MNTGNAIERCFSFINCQLSPARGPVRYEADGQPRMAVTISRQTGSGAMIVAEKLAAYLQEHASEDCPWTVFDRNLMEQVLEEHHLPKRIAEFLPEDRTSAISDMMEELLGLHPSSRTLVYQTTETILHLAELGRVILVGRAANVITAKLPHAFHVRLVAPLDTRLDRAQDLYRMDRKETLAFIRRTDQGRARYLLKYFGKRIDDPLLYDLVINTDRISMDATARMIGEAVLNRAESLPREQPLRDHAYA